jgi:hypothetical protein
MRRKRCNFRQFRLFFFACSSHLILISFIIIIIIIIVIHKGKTHIAKRICRFLSFFHDIPSQIFNAGDYRRQLFGATMPASFYDPTNEEGSSSRIKACNAALDDLIAYMQQEGVRVAAFDATNGTKERREYLMQSLKSSGIGAKIIFLESLCDNEQVSFQRERSVERSRFVPFLLNCSPHTHFPLLSLFLSKLLEENIRRVKLNTPDYRDLEPEAAVADFKRRRDHYMSVYETLEENEGPHIKIINSKRFIGTLQCNVFVFCKSYVLIAIFCSATAHSQQYSGLFTAKSSAFHHESTHSNKNILLDTTWPIGIQSAGKDRR